MRAGLRASKTGARSKQTRNTHKTPAKQRFVSFLDV
jgi:hypothetical protein